MKIVTKREYKDHHTDGEVFIDDNEHRFCFSLEDIGRPYGVKIPGETCIPEGTYQVGISRSSRWDKDMLILFNKEDHSIEAQGCRYTGIRPHGGNNISDTHGCPLVAYNTDKAGGIWGSASGELFGMVRTAIDNGLAVTWTFSRRA